MAVHQILVIDDEARYRQLYAETLRKAGFDVETAASAEEAWDAIGERQPDMVVCDIRMPGVDGISFLQDVVGRFPTLPCLLITAYADIRDAVKALKLGATDYLEKPIDLDELVAAARDALNVSGTTTEAEPIPAELKAGIVAESPIMRSLLRDAFQVAASDATVLITGESGSGKGVLAEFIHRCSSRPNAPLVALNCGALPVNVLASELFGHERGAFTGAIAPRKGIFREADGGSLFLDEIGDMPLELQPSLLRAIEFGRVSPLGSDKELAVDVRLLAATHRDLSEAVESGSFREDLYYRINVIALDIPPLRERPDDILPLARHFLSRRPTPKRLSAAAARVLESYGWPGNTRELANAMERAAILSNTDIILPENLPPAVVKGAENGETRMASPGQSQVQTMVEVEKEAIKAALEKTGGNRTKAAQLLGISRRALVYKLKRMGIND